MNENVKTKVENIKQIIIFLSLTIWLIIPVLKAIRGTFEIVIKYEYTFMIIVGAIGIFLLILNILDNLKKIEDKKKYDKEILPITIFGIFLIWTFISSIFSSNIKNAFWGTEYRKDGYITYLAYAGFFSYAFLLKSQKHKKMLINIFLISALLNIITAELYNRCIFAKVFVPRTITRTCFYNSNHYGYYLLFAVIVSNFLFVVEKNRFMKIAYLFLYSLFLYYIILNNTFGCYISILIILLIFMLFCMYKQEKRLLSIVSIAIFIIVTSINQEVRTITTNNTMHFIKDINNIAISEQQKNNDKTLVALAESGGSGRIKLWKYGIYFFLQRPILGYGPENIEKKYLEVGINQDRPHNLIIQLATTSGIVGILTYIIALGIILLRAIKKVNIKEEINLVALTSVIAYLFSAMFGNSMYYTSPYFFIFLGFLMYENMKKTKNSET